MQDNIYSLLKAYIDDCFLQPSVMSIHLSGEGATSEFEEQVKTYYKKRFAISFSNATSALQTACFATELYNSEIITSPINWGPSVASLLLPGNKLCFSSIESDSLNLDVSSVASAITSDTKAIVSVDYNGMPADSKSIKDLCSKNNLYYISDSAQSFSAYRDGRPAGSWADIIILSFSPGKTLFAGEGACIVTDDETIYEKIISCSMHPERQKLALGINAYNEYSPFNGRMNPLAAILLNETFDTSLASIKEYQKLCFETIHVLVESGLVIKPSVINNPEDSTFFNFILKLNSIGNIEQVNNVLKENGLPFRTERVINKFIPFDDNFRSLYKGRFNSTEKLKKQKINGVLNNLILFKYLN